MFEPQSNKFLELMRLQILGTAHTFIKESLVRINVNNMTKDLGAYLTDLYCDEIPKTYFVVYYDVQYLQFKIRLVNEEFGSIWEWVIQQFAFQAH